MIGSYRSPNELCIFGFSTSGTLKLMKFNVIGIFGMGHQTGALLNFIS